MRGQPSLDKTSLSRVAPQGGKDIANISSIQNTLLAHLSIGCLVHLDIALKEMAHLEENYDREATLARFIESFRQGFPLPGEI